MLKTEITQALIEVIAKALADQVAGNRQLSQDPTRNGADRQYFTGGFDSVDMVARKVAESGLVDREAFLAACGCVA